MKQKGLQAKRAKTTVWQKDFETLSRRQERKQEMTDEEFWEMSRLDDELEEAERGCLEDDVHRDIERGLSRKQLENKYKHENWYDSTTIDSADYRGTLRRKESGYTVAPARTSEKPQDKTTKVITKVVTVIVIVIYIIIMIYITIKF